MSQEKKRNIIDTALFVNKELGLGTQLDFSLNFRKLKDLDEEDMKELMQRVEDKFDVLISDDDIGGIETINDLHNLIINRT